MSVFETMSLDKLQDVIADLNKKIELSETYGNYIETQNTIYLRDLAEEEFTHKQCQLDEQKVEDFMEQQALARDREYELEQLSKWSDHNAAPR